MQRIAPRKHESDAKALRRNPLRGVARFAFYLHLWLGVIATGILVLVSLTGILLNHKAPLGLMPDVPHEATGSFDQTLPLAELAARADAAVGPAIAGAGIDRMDVRPGDGLIKVRYDDRVVTEATIDINSGAVLEVDARNDVFLEKLHSGEIFGGNWFLLSDLAALLLLILLVTGYWLWLYPKSRA